MTAVKRKVSLFLFSCLVLVSCAAFNYKYYGLAPLPGQELQGTLLAKEEKDDLPLKHCMPDDQAKGKCVVMFTDEFHKLRIELVDLKERLKACEQKNGLK